MQISKNMILTKVREPECLGGRTITVYKEYLNDVFVNSSKSLESAFYKITRELTEFSTRQSTRQMQKVNANIICTNENMEELFPEYFLD